MLGKTQVVDVSRLEQPQLIVVVDTEEEFDWHAEPDRNATSVNAIQYVERMQAICDDYGIVPCYVIDYAVASQPDGYQTLLDFYRAGRCDIGAHLHPWVNPPDEETINRRNTYPGNLPAALERQKLRYLCDVIVQNFGLKPTIYKAGRYGIGPNTVDTLVELGFEIDLSCCPPFDYQHDGGPDFTQISANPQWFGPSAQLLEIPVTGSYVGHFGKMSHAVYQLAEKLSSLHMTGILARLNLLDRLRLSPEGYTSDEHKKLVQFLHAQGTRTFTWSFHSPSVVPGMTPYVKSEKDLSRFLDSFRRFFDYFLGELGGVATTPTLLKSRLEALR